MICIGIAIKKNELWYSVVEGTLKSNAIIKEIGKQNYKAESPSDILMADFYNIFAELIAKLEPDHIVYKLHLGSTIKQIPYMSFSLGVLNYICHQNNITISERSSSWITAQKNAKIIRTEQHFSTQKFNVDSKAATLIAWYELRD